MNQWRRGQEETSRRENRNPRGRKQENWKQAKQSQKAVAIGTGAGIQIEHSSNAVM